MAHPNEALLRKATEALNSGDMETFLGLHADDVVLHVTGRNAFSGTMKGKGEMASVFERQMQVLDGPPQFELHDVLANDEHGIALSPATGQRDGKTLHDNGVLVFHFKDGKTSEVWLHPADLYASDEFFA